MRSKSRRAIPAVNTVLDALDEYELPRPLVVDLVRRELAAERRKRKVESLSALVARIRAAIEDLRRSRLQSVINGTGVIVHTNLGRAPLTLDAVKSLYDAGGSYTNLEYDLARGERGNRGAYLERALALLCQAEAAMVVNNCAAALVVIVRHFTANKPEIVISRGELVQIGGGFRIGDIIEATGAKLREVGATNKTTLTDYARAIGKRTAMVLSVHRSNFFMEGFVASPSLAELAGLTRKHRLPLVVDLGTGLLKPLGNSDEPEPAPAEALKNGADLVCFSGDKLFGGPQAGIIVGKAQLVRALKRNPLYRALRVDKLCLAALQATTDLHLHGAEREIPVLTMAKTEKDELRARAAAVITRLQGLPARISVGRGTVRTGGGTLPRSTISSISIDIESEQFSANEFAARMRKQSPPVIGYITNRTFKLDLRTIFPHQDDAVIDAVRAACSGSLAADE